MGGGAGGRAGPSRAERGGGLMRGFPLPQEEAEEYARLSPEEQQRRLKAIVRRIDADNDGLLSKGNGADRRGCTRAGSGLCVHPGAWERRRRLRDGPPKRPS